MISLKKISGLVFLTLYHICYTIASIFFFGGGGVIKPMPPALEGKILTTWLLGKILHFVLITKYSWLQSSNTWFWTIKHLQ